IAAVAQRIRQAVEGVATATASSMVTGIADSVSGLLSTVTVLMVILWAVSSAMTVFLYVLFTESRRREFAALRAVGASRKMLKAIVAREAAIVCLIGSAVGMGAALLVLPFQNAIGGALGVGLVLPPVISMLGLGGLCIAVMAALAALSAFAAAGKALRADGAIKEEG
ncbi:MAG: ABC transporter permease, partial [Clostridia bacterium]|nr:ABC transporter permease [Clostridia bacterium]